MCVCVCVCVCMGSQYLRCMSDYVWATSIGLSEALGLVCMV